MSQAELTLHDTSSMLLADKELIFKCATSISTITKIMHEDLIDQDAECATLRPIDREGLIHALQLIGKELQGRYEFLFDRLD